MQAVFTDISKPQNKTFINAMAGTNKSIIKALHRAQPKAVEQCTKIAHHFKGSTPAATAKNIWQFLKTEIQYDPDTHTQKIKMPSVFLNDRVGDCKSYSLFTSGVLTCLGIPHAFKYVSYTSDPTPTHVYIQLEDGTIIDGVYKSFNAEKPYTNAKLYKMQVHTLTGHPVNGLKDFFKNVGDKIKDANLKKVVNAPGRGAFLILVKINWLGWATNMAAGIKTGKTNIIRSKWTSLGGNSNKLIAAINEGSKKRALFNRNVRINGIGVNGEPVSVAAMLAAAAGVVAGFKPVLDAAKRWLQDIQQDGDGSGDIYRDFSQGGGQSSDNTPSPTQPGQGTFSNITSNPALLIGAAAAAYFIFKK